MEEHYLSYKHLQKKQSYDKCLWNQLKNDYNITTAMIMEQMLAKNATDLKRMTDLMYGSPCKEPTHFIQAYFSVIPSNQKEFYLDKG